MPNPLVVVLAKGGDVMAKILQRQTSKEIELASLDPTGEPMSILKADVKWIARIIWASQ